MGTQECVGVCEGAWRYMTAHMLIQDVQGIIYTLITWGQSGLEACSGELHDGCVRVSLSDALIRLHEIGPRATVPRSACRTQGLVESKQVSAALQVSRSSRLKGKRCCGVCGSGAPAPREPSEELGRPKNLPARTGLVALPAVALLVAAAGHLHQARPGARDGGGGKAELRLYPHPSALHPPCIHPAPPIPHSTIPCYRLL